MFRLSIPTLAVAATLLVGPALAAPSLRAATVRELVAAEASLAAALAALAKAPRRSQLRRAERALTLIARQVDAYFHADNLHTSRDTALALRPVVHRLYAGPAPCLVLVDDVLHVRPAIRETLAHAWTALGDHAAAGRHRLAAVAADPSPARIEAAAATLARAGRAADAAALRARSAQRGDPPEHLEP